MTKHNHPKKTQDTRADNPPAEEPLTAGGTELADEEDEEDEAPRVVVATVADLRTWIPQAIISQHASRPVWFVLQQNADLVGLFDRYPEKPMDASTTQAILQGLRAFSVDQNESLQMLLGVTDTLQYGFHTDVPLDVVVESFEDDGFDVIAAVRDGRVALDES